jgi:hypothetical protein
MIKKSIGHRALSYTGHGQGGDLSRPTTNIFEAVLASGVPFF